MQLFSHSELESLKTQIRGLETELEGLKSAITKTQKGKKGKLLLAFVQIG